MRKLRASSIFALVIALAMLMSSGFVAAPQALASKSLVSQQLGAGNDQSSLYRNHSQSVLTGGNPSLIATGDFNNDGREDVAIGSTTQNRIEIFFTLPDGTLPQKPNKIIPLSNAPTGLASGDFDDDGLSDIVVSIAAAGEILIFNQSTDFGLQKLKTPNYPPYQLVAGDFDGDHKCDFAAICSSDDGRYSTFAVFIQAQGFAFRETDVFIDGLPSVQWEKRAKILIATDFNLDGKLDLAVASQSWGNFTIFENLGVSTLYPTFSEHQSVIVASPSSLVAAQIDGVGAEEICVVSSQNQVRVYKATSGNYTLSGSITDLNAITSLSVLRASADNLPDILITSSSSNTVQVYTSKLLSGEIIFDASPAWRFPCHSNPVASSKCGDNLLVACDAGTNGTATIFYNASEPLSNADDNMNFIGGPTIFSVADFNADSSPEIGAIIPSLNIIRFQDMDGNTTAFKSIGTAPSSIISSKLRGTYWDAAISNAGSNDVYFYWGGPNLSTSVPWVVSSNVSSPKMLCAGILTNPSLPDCVIVGSNGLQILRNKGFNPYFTQNSSLTIAVNGELTYSAIGDYTHYVDQLNDIAVVNNTDNSIWIFRQSQASPYFSIATAYRLDQFSSPVVWMTAGRFNQDSLDDLLVCLADGTAILYLQKTSHRLDPSDGVVFNLKTVVSSGAVGDFNDDGIDEIAVISSAPSRGIIYDFTSQKVIYNFTGGAGNCRLARGDLNDDNKADLIFSSPGSSSVSAIYQRDLAPHAVSECLTSSPIEGSAVSFTSRNSTDSFSERNALNYTWNFGDGIVESTDSVYISHTYENSGTYSVVLTVRDPEGLTNISSLNVIVAETTPTASFTVQSGAHYEGTPIQFTDTSTVSHDPIVSWSWDFDDGTTSNETNPTHIFVQDGTFHVKLNVTDNDGDSDTFSTSVNVLDLSPSVSFVVSNSTPLENTVVYFNDTTKAAVDPLSNWTWDFGDGSSTGPLTGQGSTTHIFAHDGTYNVTLTVWDSDGPANSTRTIRVQDSIPIVDFTYSPTHPYEEDNITFTDHSEVYDDNITNPAHWHWDFGDGSEMDGKQAWHSYSQNGTYTVTLTVTDGDGVLVSLPLDVVVYDIPPTAHFDYSSWPQENSNVAFNDRSNASQTAHVDHWNWSFGDGVYSQMQNPSHIYNNNGTFLVSLRVRDNHSAWSSLFVLEIKVNDTSPVAKSISPSSGTQFNEDEGIDFSVVADRGNDAIVGYDWRVYSGVTVVDQVHTALPYVTMSIPQSGYYTVVVEVWDHDSSDSISTVVHIVNVVPSVSFQYHVNQENWAITFDGSHSTDTPDDIQYLMYRWNFGDGKGWTSWNTSTSIIRSYLLSGTYTVSLEVRDDDGAIGNTSVQVNAQGTDRQAPLVSDVSSVTSVTVGDVMEIRANITDNAGAEGITAFLYYTVGNQTFKTNMTRETGSTYLGVIRIPSNPGSLTYWVNATDAMGNIRTSGSFQVVINEKSEPLLYIAPFLVAALLIGLVYRREAMVVDEVFLIYDDGNLIAHQTRRLKPGMDDDILSSMLVALQSFVRDSFKDEASVALNRMDFGEKKILIEKGEKIYLAVVLHGEREARIPQRMKAVIEAVEKEYGPILSQWDGDYEKVRGIKEKTQSLFKVSPFKYGKAKAE